MPDTSPGRCRAPFVPCADLEAMVTDSVRGLELDDQVLGRLDDALVRLGASEGERRASELSVLRRALVAANEKVLRLGKHLADAALSVDEYKPLADVVRRERDALLARSATLERDVSELVAVLRRHLTVARSLRHVFDWAATPAEQKVFLQHVLAKIVVRDRHLEHMEYAPPFDLLLGDLPRKGSKEQLDEAVGQRLGISA